MALTESILDLLLTSHRVVARIGYVGTHPVSTFFGVFANYNDWSWNSLPKAYLDSSYLSVDKGAISTYFTEVEGGSTHSNSMLGDGDLNLNLEPPEHLDDMSDEPPEKKVCVYVHICCHV